MYKSRRKIKDKRLKARRKKRRLRVVMKRQKS